MHTESTQKQQLKVKTTDIEILGCPNLFICITSIALNTQLNKTLSNDTIGCLNTSQSFKLDFQASKKFTKHILHKALELLMTGEYKRESITGRKAYLCID